ncbi:MAG: 6-bladed beta-propeller [Bacteroidaceae bacterium]|nr:6-bladed beta-propeller [Bacteroidaceae bacterium]
MKIFDKSLSLGISLMSCLGCTNTASDTLGNIDIAGAMRELESIKLSEIADNIAYVPLETSDSSLLSPYNRVHVTEEYIIISHYSPKAAIRVFDRYTGKYLHDIGYVSNDPWGYASYSRRVNYWVDEMAEEVYCNNWDNTLQVYGFDGKHRRSLSLFYDSINVIGWSANSMSFSQDEINVYSEWRSQVPRVVSFDKQGNPLHVYNMDVRRIQPTEKSRGVTMHARDSLFGSFTVFLDYDYYGSSNCVFNASDAPRTYTRNGTTYLKETFVDTIYTLQKGNKIPYLTFNMGEYLWPYDKRMEGADDNRMCVLYTLENDDLVYFTCGQNIYDWESANKRFFCGYYDKKKKNTRMMRGVSIKDNILHGPAFRIMGMNQAGEFFTVIQPSELLDMDEEVLSPQLRELRQRVKEDDNPIIAIAY